MADVAHDGIVAAGIGRLGQGDGTRCDLWTAGRNELIFT
jgi:hypothetical protein